MSTLRVFNAGDRVEVVDVGDYWPHAVSYPVGTVLTVAKVNERSDGVFVHTRDAAGKETGGHYAYRFRLAPPEQVKPEPAKVAWCAKSAPAPAKTKPFPATDKSIFIHRFGTPGKPLTQAVGHEYLTRCDAQVDSGKPFFYERDGDNLILACKLNGKKRWFVCKMLEAGGEF